jgi:hypothetical protein
MGAPLDFPSFLDRIERASTIDPRQATRVTENLVAGALRIRRGVTSDVMRPVTKPAEAIGAWINAIKNDDPEQRGAELREALVAAAEEVDRATTVAPYPNASRMRDALYSDALTSIGDSNKSSWFSSPTVPWILASMFGGILIGIFFSRKK